MLCIKTWSFGMGRDVWAPIELSGSRHCLRGWEEGEGVRGSVNPWLGRRLQAFGGSLGSPITGTAIKEVRGERFCGSLDSPITGWRETAWRFRGSYHDSSH